MLTLMVVVSCSYDDSALWDEIFDHEERITKLEDLCNKMNTNITSLKTIVDALQKNDYVTSVSPISENGKEIGYFINFSKSGSITIYHGKDGVDGKDGHTPVIGIKKDADDTYYWTVDGEWLCDDEGNKMKAVGQDGVDGMIPTLKIEDAYWFVSYDQGLTWMQLGKATGLDGDSFFQSVEVEDDAVYFKFCDGSNIMVPLVSHNYLSKIQSITYVPRFTNHRGAVVSTSREYSFVELDFLVSPKNLLADIVDNFTEDMRLQAISTFTKSFGFTTLPISSVTVDKDDGILTVRAKCNNLSDDFFSGLEGNSVSLQLSDDNYSISSEFIQIEVAERIVHESNQYPKVVAHRGYWKADGSAQNSITALRKANEINVWGCELDLWMTSDNVLVLNHDGVIDNISIQYSPYSAVKDCKLSNGETLPTFEQYLQVFKNECYDLILLIELKPHYSNEVTTKAICEIIKMVNKFGVSEKVEYISFSPIACDAIVRYAPTARVSYLESDLTPLQCIERGYSGVDYHNSTYRNNVTWVKDAHNYGLEVNTWTLNTVELVTKMKGYGVDIVTTDYPLDCLQWIRN